MHETTLISWRKENAEQHDRRQSSVFMTNAGSGWPTEYGYRWVIESEYRSINRVVAATLSTNVGLGSLYFAFGRLLYSIGRAIDILVQVEVTGEHTHFPIVTADNALTLLRRR